MPRVVCPLRHLWNQKDSCGSEREAVGVESIALLAEANRGTEVDDKIVPGILTHPEREVALSGLHGLIWKGHCFAATNAATVSPTSPPPLSWVCGRRFERNHGRVFYPAAGILSIRTLATNTISLHCYPGIYQLIDCPTNGILIEAKPIHYN